MAVRRIRARTAASARNKATTKYSAVGRVNYVKGTKKGGMRSYSVATHKRK